MDTPSPPETSPKSQQHRTHQRNRFRWLRIAGVCLIGSLLIGYFVVVPLYVRNRVKQALRDLGIVNAAFDIGSVSLTRARFARIELGEQSSLTATSIDVTYSLATLFRGKVNKIDIHGARWNVKYDQGLLDIGFDAARLPASEGESDLAFDQLTLQGSSVVVQTAGVRNVLEVAGAIRRIGSGRFDASLKLGANRLSYSVIDVADPKVDVQLSVSSLVDGSRAVEGRIEVAAASSEVEQYQLLVPDIAVVVPVSTHGSAPDEGSIATGSVLWRGQSIPPPTGGVSIADSRARVWLSWPVSNEAVANVNGWLEFRDSPLHGRLTARVSEFELTDASLIRALVPALRDAVLGGRLALDSTFTLADGRLDQRVVVKANRLLLDSKGWPGRIDDADGVITFTSLFPLATESDQSFFVNQATVGKVQFTDGAAVFTVHSPNRITVQHAAWNMATDTRLGRFGLEPFVVDPSRAQFKSSLHCEDVDLGAWLELLSNGRVTGDGQLEGLVSFEFDAARIPAVVLSNGVLEASPPQGSIQIRNHEMIDQVISRIDSGGQQFVREVRDRIALALRDFEYSSLRAELTPAGRDVECQITTQGKGRIGPNAQEFASISLNVSPFNAIVRRAVLGADILETME